MSYEVIEDTRTGKKFLDDAGGIVRNFEKVLGSYKTKQEATKAHPEVKDVSQGGD